MIIFQITVDQGTLIYGKNVGGNPYQLLIKEMLNMKQILIIIALALLTTISNAQNISSSHQVRVNDEVKKQQVEYAAVDSTGQNMVWDLSEVVLPKWTLTADYTEQIREPSPDLLNSNANLTIQDILNLFGKVTISIESGGELVIDGGVITNADIDLAAGGKLTIKNGGKLIMRTGTDFKAPIGTLVDIENGAICNSNDF